MSARPSRPWWLVSASGVLWLTPEYPECKAQRVAFFGQQCGTALSVDEDTLSATQCYVPRGDGPVWVDLPSRLATITEPRFHVPPEKFGALVLQVAA